LCNGLERLQAKEDIRKRMAGVEWQGSTCCCSKRILVSELREKHRRKAKQPSLYAFGSNHLHTRLLTSATETASASMLGLLQEACGCSHCFVGRQAPILCRTDSFVKRRTLMALSNCGLSKLGTGIMQKRTHLVLRTLWVQHVSSLMPRSPFDWKRWVCASIPLRYT